MENKERHIRQTLTRREFLKLSGAGLAGAALLGTAAGCGGGDTGDSSSSRLVFTSYGGSFQEAQAKAWLNPYSDETGTQIQQDSPTDYAKIQAMVENNNVTWDVVDVGNDYGLQSTADLLEPLDYSVINREPILEGYADEHRVANILYSNILAFRTDQFESKPENWTDFFDLEKFPGQRGMYNNPSQTIEIALLGDGVSADNLYPLDIERALAKLDTIKPQIVWWDTGAQSRQQIADGEVAMTSAWNGRVQTAINNGAPVEIQWNQNLATADYLVVPKGAPNKEQAMDLIAYCVSGENNHRITNYIAYAPVNQKSIPKINSEIAPQLPTAHREVSVDFDSRWWDENRDRVTEQFNSWTIA